MATPTSAATPRRRRSPRLLVAGAVGLLGFSLAGCSNGFNAQTDEIYQPGPGISVRQGGVYLLNAAIVTDGSGNGTLIGALLDQSRTPDRLVSAKITGPKAPTVTIIPGTITLPVHRSVQLADTSDVRLVGTLTTGTFLSLSLTFHNAAPINVQIPVLPRTTDFHDVLIGPPPPTLTPIPTTPATSTSG